MAKPPRDKGGPKLPVKLPVKQDTTANRRAEQTRSDARTTSLEAGKTLQRILDAAPGALVQKGIDPATEKQARRVLDLAGGLEVHVPVGEVKEQDIDVRVDLLRRQMSWVAPRGHGERVQMGDEILVDLLGYLGGEVFIAHTDTWYVVQPNPVLPELFESLVGANVPDHRIIHVRLRDDYPVKAHAGRVAVFAVAIKEGRHRVMPDVEDPAFLPFLNRGVKTLEDLRAKLREEITQERAQQMVDHAKLLLLRELYLRCADDHVPEELVEEELARRWRVHHGEAMIRQGVSLDEQRRSQGLFAVDVNQRAEARRVVWEMRILEALADALGIEVTDGQLKPVLGAIFGNDQDLDTILYKNPGLHRDLLKGLRLRRATEALLKKAKVYFDAPPTPPDKAYVPLTAARAPEDKNVMTAARGLTRPPSKGPPPKG